MKLSHAFWILIGILVLIKPLHSHDHDNPEVNEWLKKLTNQINGSCCDGSDALSINDPDWDVNGDENFPYKVKLDGTWILVFKDNVVKQTNTMGIARVWPYHNTDETGAPVGPWQVRCFLPGSGA